MGYTHYAHGKVTLTEDIVADVKTIIALSGVAIRGWDGTGKPIISTEEIRLNGAESLDEDFETFTVISGQEASFCKTGHRPYDAVVVAILMLLTEYAARNGEVFHWESDGGESDHAAGRALWLKVATAGV